VKEQKTVNPWENLVPVYVIGRTMQVRNEKYKQRAADPSIGTRGNLRRNDGESRDVWEEKEYQLGRAGRLL